MFVLSKTCFALSLLLCCVSVRARFIEVAQDGKPVIPIPQSCRKYRTLLALDGGGLKGIITTQVLIAVSNHTKQYLVDNQHLLKDINSTFHYDRISDFHIDLADYFDAVAGISAGSWIATYIASKGGGRINSARIFNQAFIRQRYGFVRPGAVEGLEVFFMEYGARIYPLAWPIGVGRPRFWPLPWQLPSLRLSYATVPAHPVGGLEWTLNQFLGDTKLSDVYTSLLVVAFDLNTRSALQFVHDKIEPSGYDLRRLEAARALAVVGRGGISALKLRKRYGSECPLEGEIAKLEIHSTVAPYLNITDVIKGTGNWSDPKPKKFVPKTRVGQIRNFVFKRSVKDYGDYLKPGMDFSKNVDFHLRDIARASSAFPILHPSKRILPLGGKGAAHEVIDGAMVGNNPTMQAWIWLMRKIFVRIEDVATLSIGTGTVKQRLDNLARAGALQWSASLTFILLDDSSEFQQSTLNALFQSAARDRDDVKPNQSLRIQLKRDTGTREGTLLQVADNPSALNGLRTMGRETAEMYRWNIKDFVESFIFAGCTRDGIKETDAELLEKEFKKDHEEFVSMFWEYFNKVCPE